MIDRHMNAPVISCNNCYVNFDLTGYVFFQKKSSDCDCHEFNVPEGVLIHEINEPSFFIVEVNK